MLEMLKSKKPVLRKQEWIEFVRMTEQSIVLSPEQYLSDFERNELTIRAVHQVFEEFITEVFPPNA
jgi:hypothetical protein